MTSRNEQLPSGRCAECGRYRGPGPIMTGVSGSTITFERGCQCCKTQGHDPDKISHQEYKCKRCGSTYGGPLVEAGWNPT